MSPPPPQVTVEINGDLTVFKVRLPESRTLTDCTQLMAVSVNGVAFALHAAPSETKTRETPADTKTRETPADTKTRETPADTKTRETPNDTKTPETPRNVAPAGEESEEEFWDTPRNVAPAGEESEEELWDPTKTDAAFAPPLQLSSAWRSEPDELERRELQFLDSRDVALMAITKRMSGAVEVATLLLSNSGHILNGYIVKKESSRSYMEISASVAGKVVILHDPNMAKFVRSTFPEIRRIVFVRGNYNREDKCYVRCTFHTPKTRYPCATHILQCMRDSLGKVNSKTVVSL